MPVGGREAGLANTCLSLAPGARLSEKHFYSSPRTGPFHVCVCRPVLPMQPGARCLSWSTDHSVKETCCRTNPLIRLRDRLSLNLFGFVAYSSARVMSACLNPSDPRTQCCLRWEWAASRSVVYLPTWCACFSFFEMFATW